MHDMLVKLYELEKYCVPVDRFVPTVTLRKPIGPEKHRLVEWVGSKFNNSWASEVDMTMGNRPVTCFIAVVHSVLHYELAGFACYDATARGFFGPMGVTTHLRGKGIGKALLLTALLDMRNNGYGYAVIGGVGPAEFYKKAIGAVDIPDSTPGIWATWVQ